jgi:hypothetical protein
MTLETWQVIAGIIGAALGGGGVLSLLIKRGQSKDELAVKILLEQFASLKKENERLRSEIDALKKREDLKDRTINEMQIQIMSLQIKHDTVPFATWFKNEHLIMERLSKKYIHNFLTPRGYQAGDYIGKTDHSVWPDDIAKSYQENDRKVLRTQKTWIGLETLHTNGGKEDWLIIKTPEAEGIRGIAVAMNELLMDPNIEIKVEKQ